MFNSGVLGSPFLFLIIYILVQLNALKDAKDYNTSHLLFANSVILFPAARSACFSHLLFFAEVIALTHIRSKCYNRNWPICFQKLDDLVSCVLSICNSY